MSRRRGGRLLALLVVLAGIGAAVWLFRDRLPGFGAERMASEVSPEAAALAERKLRALRDGRTVRMNDVELTSLLRFRLRDRIPGDLAEPTIRLAGDTVELSARIPTDRLPPIRELERVRGFLPDTADVQLSGAVRTREPGRGYFLVRAVRFAGIPIPPRFFPEALRNLGRPPDSALPAEAFPFRFPDGVATVRVDSGTLLLQPPRSPN